MLPDLPAIIGNWDWEYQYPTPSAIDWTPIIGADPCRWIIAFCAPAANFPVVCPQPEIANSLGFVVPAFDRIDFKYQDYGAWIQQPWMTNGRGAVAPFIVLSVAIRLRQFSESNERRWMRELKKMDKPFRDFIRAAIDNLNNQSGE